MIITQYIVDQMIAQINTALGGAVCGAGIAIKDIAGQVVSLNTSQTGEREYLGLTDTKGTYFYIRLANTRISETRKAANLRRGSCGIEQETRVQLKIVAMTQCADVMMWAEVVKQALYNVNLNLNWPYSVTSAKLFPNSSNINSWEIYQEETGKKPETLLSLIKIVSVDFELRYNYTYNNKCDNIKLC